MTSNLSNVYHFFKIYIYIYIYTRYYITHTHIYIYTHIYISINRISYIFYTQNIFKEKIN